MTKPTTPMVVADERRSVDSVARALIDRQYFAPPALELIHTGHVSHSDQPGMQPNIIQGSDLSYFYKVLANLKFEIM